MSEPNDTPESPDISQIPEAIVAGRGHHSYQLVWIIPIVAAIIGASLAVKSYLDRGPVITITFKSGEGIDAGKTKIKYRNVTIGEVKAVNIDAGCSQVVVTAEIFKDADWLLVQDTRFWVVRARISRNSISGLGTLMEGSYIGVDAGTSKQSRHEFKGLERPPVVATDEAGRQFVLHAMDIGSLDLTSPVFFRRMEAGEVIAYEPDKDGTGVTLKVFIRAPYDQYVKANTLFWHASGIDFRLDANGIKVDTESMVTLLLGGISFVTPGGGANAQPASPNTVFTLFANKDEAMRNPDTVVETYALVFKESVRGLSIGAPVDLRGVTVGEVSRINIDLDTLHHQISVPVEVRFYPERLRAHYRTKAKQRTPLNSRQLIDAMVKNGLRAHLRSASLLTGQLYIALDFFPEAALAKADWSKNPPEFPTVTGSMEQFQAALMQIVQKIDKLPLEALAGDARQAMQTLGAALKSADTLLKDVDSSVVPEAHSMLKDGRKALDDARMTLADIQKTLVDVQKTLADGRKTLDDGRETLHEGRKALGGVNQVLSPDAPLQLDLRETLRELGRAAQSLRVLSDYLERHPESLIQGKENVR